MAIDFKRTAFIGVAAATGIFAGIYGQPLIHGNDRAINVIVTVFSILAGFLVAIMTIMGDPTGFVVKSWRYAEMARPNIYRKLLRQKYMFILYLGILSLVMVESLIEKKLPQAATIMEQIYLGAAVVLLCHISLNSNN